MTKRSGPRVDKRALVIGIPHYGRIDKADPALLVREPERTVDHAYRQSARGRPCDVWGCTEDPATVVGAHLRISLPGLPGAGARKPHDGLIAYLCYRCHDLFDGRCPTTADELQHLKDRLIAGLLMQRYRLFQQSTKRATS